MRIVVFAARILVAAVFLFSGFVKLVDPLGSSYKFQEYFGEDVLNLEFLIPFALPFSILLILVEILLGVTLLIGYKPKWTVWSLFGINLLFLFLTWYSAYYDKVTDCGCFGDALKLSPWDTFYKNVILLIVLVPLFQFRYLKPIFSQVVLKRITIFCFLVFVFITNHVLMHLPIVDFRAYAIGKNIIEGMEYQDDSDELPPVHDFFLESETEDLTTTILEASKSMLIISYNLDVAEEDAFTAVKEVAQKAKDKGYLVYGVSASATSELTALQKKLGLPFEFLFCDETTLKTMIRANPGIMILKNATITGKWNWRDADKVLLD
ncbi:MAG: MauE/DoxX family redox-associated membrane protein [Flavicella sp.]